jgi:hypothetical protein
MIHRLRFGRSSFGQSRHILRQRKMFFEPGANRPARIEQR